MDQTQQGIILKHFGENYLRSKIRNEHYNYIRNLKGNSNNKKYLYLDLRKKRLLDQYLKYFSEDSDLFEIYRMGFMILRIIYLIIIKTIMSKG